MDSYLTSEEFERKRNQEQFTVVRESDPFTPFVEPMDLENAEMTRDDFGPGHKVVFADQVAYNEL